MLYRYKDATPVLMRALEIYMANKLDSNNRLVKDTLKSLIKVLKQQNRDEEAKSILQRVLFGGGEEINVYSPIFKCSES